ncbi:hypothetical protein CIB95_14880 [Lottiidibacillus patelloidae]|uniref:DUF3299 domain-containing protein n=1 Tax=Lottiidibacillus patelloidae TaxID=2670334 RepID=A0A263BQE0_9BACI|nr:hypothetical protein [Lottiidibacillus patelloidae]OZM55945.1 hypothetical protein CIB95_14880 [Lottiidibacillus patelloidae]
MKKTILLLLATTLSAILLAGCGTDVAEKKETTEEKESAILTEITFEDFFTKSDSGDGQITEKMQSLNGKKVGIMGYMTELTPIDNRFIYLVPTQGAACPFCSADNPKYLEAIAIYPPNGEEVPYTEDGLWVYGTLEVGEEVDEATGLISLFRIKAESIQIYQPR